MPSSRREPSPERPLPPDRDAPIVHGSGPHPLPVYPPQPTTLSCLRCQVLGRRRLLCSRADACREAPLFLPLGPLLLLGWLVTAVAFVLATR